jgi:hypothetical protein
MIKDLLQSRYSAQVSQLSASPVRREQQIVPLFKSSMSKVGDSSKNSEKLRLVLQSIRYPHDYEEAS